MKSIATALGLMAAMVMVSPAFAEDAWVVKSSPGGEVLVNHGDGYRRVGLEGPLRAGDQVIAQGGGEGWILYCGCDVPLREGKVYTVEQRQCPVYSVNVAANGLPHTTMLKPLEEEEITRCRGVAPLWWAVGAGAAVGICAAAGCFDDDDDPRKRKKKKEVSVSP